MPHAIRIHATGGPEVLTWEEVAVGDPGPGEARVRHTAVGVNYIDTYHRSGLYKLPLPSGSATKPPALSRPWAPASTGSKPGDRVAYGSGPLGAYSERRVMPADRLVKLPDGVSDERGDADAEGAHRPVPVPPDVQAQGRRHDPVPRGGRRRRTHRLPMGAGAGRDDDRHRRLG